MSVTYAIEAVGTGLVKIGAAADLQERLFKLQYPCPVELVVIAKAVGNIERRLHAELTEYRAHGEWFRKTEQVMAAIADNMEPEALSVLSTIGVGSRGKTRGKKHTCKRCGDLGHHARTCAAQLPELRCA